MPALALLLQLAAAAAVAGPKIEHWQTSSGARVYFVAAPEIPMVDVRVVFDAGSARDGTSAGLAQLTNGLLSEGAGGRSADEILEGFAAVGASFGNGALRDMAWVELRSITDPDHLQPALKNLALLLQRPDFPADAFGRERDRMLIGLRNQQQDPGDIADKAFYEQLYAGHPYAVQPEGTEESLPRLQRVDCERFHAAYYVAANAVVAIVGAVDRAAAEAIAERVTGKLPRGRRPAALPPVASRDVPVEQRLYFPSQQTHLLLGQPGMSRQDPDYFALYVGNHVLGGSGLVSLLSEEVREKRGLSYSVYSYFSPMRVAGPFTAGLQTRNDQAQQALEVLRETLRDFAGNGPTEEQLVAAKKNITGGFALRIDSNRKITEYLAMIGFYDMPLDYLDTFTQKVEAVTREQVTATFRRRVDIDKMVTISVGGAVDDAETQAKSTAPAK